MNTVTIPSDEFVKALIIAGFVDALYTLTDFRAFLDALPKETLEAIKDHTDATVESEIRSFVGGATTLN
jgi:hypothetical protein